MAIAFHESPGRWIALFVWLVWLSLYWEGGKRALEDIRKAARAGRTLDLALMVTIALASLGLVAGGAGAAAGWISLPPEGRLSLAGTCFTLLGAAGTVYSRRTLGAMWTAEASLQAEHHIVDRGPYGVVRHPIYSAAILLYLGLFLAFPLGWMRLLALAVMLAYAAKTRLEDVFLAENLPGYEAYRQRVRYRLFPGVW